MRTIFPSLLLASLLGAQDSSPRQELGLTLGRVLSDARLGLGTAMQVDYGYRVATMGSTAVFVDVHFLANPQRKVSVAEPTATQDVAALFLTPGVRLKFLYESRVSPYVTAGGGLSVLEHSRTVFSGQPNPAPRTTKGAAFTYGAGVDVRIHRWLALRGEVRDFYAGSPVLNLRNVPGRQNTVVVSGGLVLQFR